MVCCVSRYWQVSKWTIFNLQVLPVPFPCAFCRSLLGCWCRWRVSVADLRGILLMGREVGLFAWWIIPVPSCCGLPLIFEWYQITYIKNKAKKKKAIETSISSLHCLSLFFGQLITKEGINKRVGSVQIHIGFASPASVLYAESPYCSAIAQSKTDFTCNCWTPHVLSLNIVKSIMEKIHDFHQERKKYSYLYLELDVVLLRISNVKTLTSRKMETALLTVQPSYHIRFKVVTCS